MSAAEIADEIRRLPNEERIQVLGEFLAELSREEFDRILRQSRVAALDRMFAVFDSVEHVGKGMTEEEIIALSMRKK